MSSDSGYRQINAMQHAGYDRNASNESSHTKIPRGIGRHLKGLVVCSLYCCSLVKSRKDPLGPSFDKFIKHDANVIDHESANIESEEFGRVVDAELEPEVCLRRMLQPWIFYLSRDLIYIFF